MEYDPYDGFDDWADVQRQFSGDWHKEPEAVFLAYYTYENWSGDATVIWYDAGKYYMNTGGHCSCYGLEDQWNPDEYESKELLLACLGRNNERNRQVIHLIEAHNLQIEVKRTPLEL